MGKGLGFDVAIFDVPMCRVAWVAIGTSSYWQTVTLPH